MFLRMLLYPLFFHSITGLLEVNLYAHSSYLVDMSEYKEINELALHSWNFLK
uniref:Uncharacterized protein n=1 Tax=Arundo donax TaxID=35708 RepID=A0A0A9A8Y9_ARUDO